MPPVAPLEIIEILRPASQGRTIPFLCRGEDEELYYVKGRTAGARGQYCEWLVAHLAEAFGLPIPPFRLVNVPEDLIAESSKEHQSLGAGIAFASLARTQTQWFENSFVAEVPRDLRCAVLAFDWWIQNSDRLQDNPNLLWSPASKELVVIDHAFAFADDFWPTVFLEYHIFKDDWQTISSDMALQADLQLKMIAGVAKWREAAKDAPKEWTTRGYNEGAEDLLDCVAALNILNRHTEGDLWTKV